MVASLLRGPSPHYQTVSVQAVTTWWQACPTLGQTRCARQPVLRSQSTAANLLSVQAVRRAGSPPGGRPPLSSAPPPPPRSCAAAPAAGAGHPAAPAPAVAGRGHQPVPTTAPLGSLLGQHEHWMASCITAQQLQQTQQQLVLWSRSRRLRQHLQWRGGQGTRAAAQQTHSISWCCERHLQD